MNPAVIVAGIVGGLGFLLALRLARGAWASRRFADWTVALFFGAGVAGIALDLGRRQFGDLEAQTDRLLYHAMLTVFVVPIVCMALFTWQTFRPREAWARLLAFALAGGAVLLHAWLLWLGPALGLRDAGQAVQSGADYWFYSALRGVPFVWGASEAFAYHGRARRQLALGLIDPLLANRFLLWTLWSAGAGGLVALRVLAPLFYDPSDPSVEAPLAMTLAQVACGALTGIGLTLTFAPPPAYQDWIRRSS